MSIASMNRIALARAARAKNGKVPSEPIFAAALGGSEGDDGNQLSRLTRYIPTEAITLYVALLGVVGAAGASYTGRWIAFALFVLLTPSMAYVDWRIAARRYLRSDRGAGRVLLRFNLGAATIAFAAWAFSLPASPFNEFAWYDPKWGGFVALAASIALTKAEALALPLEE